MFSRQCVKITSSTRTIIFRKFPFHRKVITIPYECRCSNYHITRSIATTPPIQYAGSVPHEETVNTPTVSTELTKTTSNPVAPSGELLEKLIASLSSDIYKKNRVYKNDVIRIINKIKDIKFSSKKQELLLIHCCTELLPDESPTSRMNLVEEIWNAIRPHRKFEVEHYNELLRVYIANNRTLTVRTFVNQMSPIQPNITTYELILKALGEAGDLNQATEVISNMKAQGIPATENVFNSLIICQGKEGNLKNIEEVLIMMKTLELKSSADTYTATTRALAMNKKADSVVEEMEKAQKNGIQFEETHVMEIVKTLASVNSYGPISEVLRFLPESILKTPSITPYMQSVTTLLVYQNHPIAALEIYKCLPLPSFGPMDDQGLHGRSLVRDCVRASMPSSVIGLITQELMSSGRNPIAIQNAAEAALQFGKVPLALDLFTRMQQLGMPIRPHYFWPILLHSSKTYGEKGIMNTLSTMVKMDVQPDYETIVEYSLPYVSFTSPQNLMKKFMDTGLTISTVLTPMMETLLNTGQVRAASEICELFQGKVDAEKVLRPLLKGFLTSFDLVSTVHCLEDITAKASDKNKDWVGRFLSMFMQHKKVKEDMSDFMNLLKSLHKTKLKISTGAADFCMANLPEKYKQDVSEPFRDLLIELTDEAMVDEGDIFVNQLPHPKHMNEESLRAHLQELEAKGMNTRGVLRKLLQHYCKEGKLKAAREIAEKCENEGVFLSAGMKAAIFDLHVKLGELDMAELALAELNKSSPNFTLDEFKVIDFATLMVYRLKIGQAFDLISEQSKRRRIVGGRGITMNCWRLLDAVAAHGTHIETRQMFELLTSLRYCQPSNALLGPLIRVHLKNHNLQEAVQEFVRIGHKYNRTPLKHELLCNILVKMSDGKTEENFLINEKSNGRLNKMVQTILNIDKKVHGAGDVQLTLISALADVGFKKTLRKLLLDPTVKFHHDALLRRCERFADEKKVAPLETIAECARDLRHVDVEEVYDLILDVHQRNDNAQAALDLFTRMQDIDAIPSKKFITNLCSLLKANNRAIPSDLAVLLDKSIAKASKTQ